MTDKAEVERTREELAVVLRNISRSYRMGHQDRRDLDDAARVLREMPDGEQLREAVEDFVDYYSLSGPDLNDLAEEFLANREALHPQERKKGD